MARFLDMWHIPQVLDHHYDVEMVNTMHVRPVKDPSIPTDLKLTGKNALDANAIFSATTQPGIKLTTTTTADDQIALSGNDDAANLTAWYATQWNTDKSLIYKCSFRTGNNVADMAFWAGLRTLGWDVNGAALNVEPNRATFVYSNGAGGTTSSTTDGFGSDTATTLFFVYSIDNTDYITDLEIPFTADTNYDLSISMGVNRTVSVTVRVDGIPRECTLAQTSGSVVLASNTACKSGSLALTADTRLYTAYGIQNRDAAARYVTLSRQSISRKL